MAADRYGKLKTILQIVAVCPLMLHYPLFGLNSAAYRADNALHRLGNDSIFRWELSLQLFSGQPWHCREKRLDAKPRRYDCAGRDFKKDLRLLVRQP